MVRRRIDYLRSYVGFHETWVAKPLSRIIKVTVNDSGGETIFEERYWIGHLNTSPTQNDLLTFCYKGPWDWVDNRTWGMNVVSGEVWKIRARVRHVGRSRLLYRSEHLPRPLIAPYFTAYPDARFYAALGVAQEHADLHFTDTLSECSSTANSSKPAAEQSSSRPIPSCAPDRSVQRAI